MEEKYMKIAIEQAKKAYNNDDVPVGAVIIKNNKVHSKAYNKREKTKSISRHAEIIAIEKASKKDATWHLDECILYVTLEPCTMCAGAIIQSRIKKVIYSIDNEKFGASNILEKNGVEVVKGLCEEESKKTMKEFFQNKRK